MKDIAHLLSSLLGVSLGACTYSSGPTLRVSDASFSCGFQGAELTSLLAGTSLEGADYLRVLPKGKALGVPCATVQDQASCEARLQQLRDDISEQQKDLLHRSDVLLIERGGVFEVRSLFSVQEEVNINKPKDAVLFVFLSGFEVCRRETIVSEKNDSYWVQIGMPGGDLRCSRLVEKIHVSKDKKILRYESLGGLCVGRRPTGLIENDRTCPDSLGTFFADIAWQEAASVPAFLLLQRNLSAHGAPVSMQQRALAASSDEARHTALISSLARRFGVTPNTARVEHSSIPGLLEMARENLVEGCVNETFSALLACYQAKHAKDPQIAAIMQSVSQDEIQHAQLSHDIADWILPQLSSEEQSMLRQEQQLAFSSLTDDLVQLSEEERALCGYPSQECRRQLLRQLKKALS